MPTFNIETAEINVFKVESVDLYTFSQCFDLEKLFEALREYYDSDYYRYEVPADNLDKVETILSRYCYDLNRVAFDAIEPFCVVKQKDTDHADISPNSVYHTNRGSMTVFVMQDRLSSQQAIEQGATPLADSSINFQL